ncbi:MAG: lysophospholipid acyltransferase family protein [Pseudomonadota bacterium]
MYRITRHLFWYFCRFFFRFYCPLKAYGKHHLPEGSFLICSNHSSHADTAALVIASGLSLHRFAMLAAQDYFFNHWFKSLLLQSLMCLVRVSREAKLSEMKNVMKQCKKISAKHPTTFIMYPEGTRTKTGKVGSFKRGSIWLAHKLNIPIVPAYINGTFDSLPKGKLWPRPTPITVKFGQPLTITLDKHNSSKQITELSRQLQQLVIDLKENDHENN